MIPKAERDADAAILAAATGGMWITVAPRSQEGGVQLAGFGPALAKDWPTATSLRVGGADSSTAEKAALVAVEAARMTMEQHAANAKAAAHAVNRLPVYIEAAAEMERLKTLIAETAQRHEKEAKGLRKRGNADAAALKMAFSEELYRVLGEFWMGPEATKDFERLLRGSK